jgi:hypothetical protein
MADHAKGILIKHIAWGAIIGGLAGVVAAFLTHGTYAQLCCLQPGMLLTVVFGPDYYVDAGPADPTLFYAVSIIGQCLFGGIIGLAVGAYSIHRGRIGPKPGYCEKCGYNLKGLPESRCPECGTRFERN